MALPVPWLTQPHPAVRFQTMPSAVYLHETGSMTRDDTPGRVVTSTRRPPRVATMSYARQPSSAAATARRDHLDGSSVSPLHHEAAARE
jgi:hypothetical protein